MAAKNNEGEKAKKLIEDTLGVKVTVSEVDESLTSSSPVTSSLIMDQPTDTSQHHKLQLICRECDKFN